MVERPPPIVVGIGELLWDRFPDGRRPGGAPANVAWHANQLGVRGLVVSRVGADAAGRDLRRLLEGRGLDLTWVQTDDESLPTGTVDVDASDANAPRYTIPQPVAWDAVEATDALLELAAEARAVCFGTLFQRARRSRRTLHAFLGAAAGALRLYDVNLRQRFFERDRVERSLEAADIVKLNESEVATLVRLLGLPGGDVASFPEVLRDRFGVEITCITRGARGCLVRARDEVVDAPGTPVEVVDAVGAGDAFTAAFLCARLEGRPLPEAAGFANLVGGLVAARAGAMPPLGEALRRLRASPHGPTPREMGAHDGCDVP